MDPVGSIRKALDLASAGLRRDSSGPLHFALALAGVSGTYWVPSTLVDVRRTLQSTERYLRDLKSDDVGRRACICARIIEIEDEVELDDKETAAFRELIEFLRSGFGADPDSHARQLLTAWLVQSRPSARSWCATSKEVVLKPVSDARALVRVLHQRVPPADGDSGVHAGISVISAPAEYLISLHAD